jgi:hypothetical protein
LTSTQGDGNDSERQCSVSSNRAARDPSLEKGPTKKIKRPKTDDEIVGLVMKQLQKGMKKMESRKTPFDPWNSIQSNDQDLDQSTCLKPKVFI